MPYKTLSKKQALRNISSVLATIGTTAGILVGCGGIGGGGGGGGSSDQPNTPGEILMNIEKDSIDVGNFSQIYIEANDINENGILLKLHYPTSLTYSKRSAVLFPGEENEEYIFPYTEATSGTDRYLVFFFFPSQRVGNDIRLALNLKGIKADENAYLEVGLTNNDPNVRDSEEFKISRPFFAPLDREDIEIRGEIVTPTPTSSAGSTPAATATPNG